jgi:hypothetical protein
MVEVVEPKPLVTLRRALALFLGLVVVLIVLGFGAMAVQSERAAVECMARAPSWRVETTVEIKFFPPGRECVYRNRRGEVVGRSRYRP